VQPAARMGLGNGSVVGIRGNIHGTVRALSLPQRAERAGLAMAVGGELGVGMVKTVGMPIGVRRTLQLDDVGS
jgi:hypothetical protein